MDHVNTYNKTPPSTISTEKLIPSLTISIKKSLYAKNTTKLKSIASIKSLSVIYKLKSNVYRTILNFNKMHAHPPKNMSQTYSKNSSSSKIKTKN